MERGKKNEWAVSILTWHEGKTLSKLQIESLKEKTFQAIFLKKNPAKSTISDGDSINYFHKILEQWQFLFLYMPV